jgi:hypothetical protein
MRHLTVLILCLQVFTATKLYELFSGWWPCQLFKNLRHFRDTLRLHPQRKWPGTGDVSETHPVYILSESDLAQATFQRHPVYIVSESDLAQATFQRHTQSPSSGKVTWHRRRFRDTPSLHPQGKWSVPGHFPWRWRLGVSLKRRRFLNNWPGYQPEKSSCSINSVHDASSRCLALLLKGIVWEKWPVCFALQVDDPKQEGQWRWSSWRIHQMAVYDDTYLGGIPAGNMVVRGEYRPSWGRLQMYHYRFCSSTCHRCIVCKTGNASVVVKAGLSCGGPEFDSN